MQVKTDWRDDLIAQLTESNRNLRAFLQTVCPHRNAVMASDEFQMQVVCGDCDAKLPHPANTDGW